MLINNKIYNFFCMRWQLLNSHSLHVGMKNGDAAANTIDFMTSRSIVYDYSYKVDTTTKTLVLVKGLHVLKS